MKRKERGGTKGGGGGWKKTERRSKQLKDVGLKISNIPPKSDT